MAKEPTKPPVKMADEVAERVVAALAPRLDAIDARFDDLRSEMNGRFDEAAAERQAIHDVLDSLPSEGDFQELDRKVAIVANDTKATRTDVRNLKAETSRLRADVKAAGITVR